MEDPAGPDYIVFQLCHQGVDAVEATLAPKEFGKRDTAELALHVTLEVNQMGLEKGLLGMQVEGRALADVDRTRVARPVGPLQPTRIDPVGRRGALWCEGNVGCRKTDLAPPLIASNHLSADDMGPAEHLGGMRHVTSQQSPSNCRRRDRFKRQRHLLERIDAHHLDPTLTTDLLKKRKVALSAMTEVQVVADNERLGASPTEQDLLGELQRRPARLGLIKLNQEDMVNSAAADQLEPFLKARQERRSTLGSQNLSRMLNEGDYGRLQLTLSCLSDRSTKNLLVAKVHAVKGAEGRDGTYLR